LFIQKSRKNEKAEKNGTAEKEWKKEKKRKRWQPRPSPKEVYVERLREGGKRDYSLETSSNWLRHHC
jgi:hypothetical protein